MTKKQPVQILGTMVFFFALVSFNNEKRENEFKNQNTLKLTHSITTPHIVFLVTEDTLNYEAHKTIPVFAELVKKQLGYSATVKLGRGTHGAYSYQDFEEIDKADLLVIFARRIALPHEQMNKLKDYLRSGKPLIGIRTANHAFTVWDKIADGFEGWPEFVPDILGCENRGYGPVEPGTDISVNENSVHHPIVKGLQPQWHSKGNIYKVTPLLDNNISVLLTGKSNEIAEPVAWERQIGSSKYFYTSLGHPSDFESENFIKLLLNGIKWALEKQN